MFHIFTPIIQFIDKKARSIAEKLEAIFILTFFSPTHEITYTAGYLLTHVHLMCTSP